MRNETNIAVLGSTGSVGRNTLAVIEQLPGFRLFGITGHSRAEELIQQARQHQPAFVVVSRDEAAGQVDFPDLAGTRFSVGKSGIIELASHPDVDVVVAAIVGRAGLESTWAAIESGKRVALANKETLVVAGRQITSLAARSQAEMIPIDSEHSAIFQCLQAGNRPEVARLILTASGGPFRDFDSHQMKYVTVEQALSHPTWNMGEKISIDSATMMNKALEIIEARWLFDISPNQISVVVHPQSIVHSMVEFRDGSVIAQMGLPDMKQPIQYALTYPRRMASATNGMDFTQSIRLDFATPDYDRFPALQLGYEVANKGGTTGAVLNAANEAAVKAFLNNKISFPDIVVACREILDNHHYEPDPSLATLLQLDRWAREEINRWIAC